jgi:hypothetical protein
MSSVWKNSTIVITNWLTMINTSSPYYLYLRQVLTGLTMINTAGVWYETGPVYHSQAPEFNLFFLGWVVFLTLIVFWFVFDMFLVRMVLVSVDCPFGFL